MTDSVGEGWDAGWSKRRCKDDSQVSGLSG